MADENDEIVIRAGPIPAAPGSKEFPCRTCGKTLYLTPSSQRFQKEHNAQVTCNDCTPMKPGDKLIVTPDTLREFWEYQQKRRQHENN